MVTVLHRLAKKLVHVSKESQISNQIAMAWRSVGTDNADLINQLEGKCFI